jgi:YmaF family
MTTIQSGSQSNKVIVSQPIPHTSPNENKPHPPCPSPDQFQTHVHEFEGSTKIAEEQEEPHNHRFAGVSSQVIPFGKSHVHVVFTNTDFFDDHHHEVAAVSGPPIEVDDAKHVHFVKSITTLDDGHFHQFQFATLIQSPLTNN